MAILDYIGDNLVDLSGSSWMKQSKIALVVECLFEEHVFEIFAKYRLYVKVITRRNRFKPAQNVSKQ